MARNLSNGRDQGSHGALEGGGIRSAGTADESGSRICRWPGPVCRRLQVRHTPKGDYLFALKQETGRPANTVLLELLPQLIAKLSFPKAMKWNETELRFARPMRWLVAVLDRAVLPIEVAGIRASNRTFGHRVMGGKRPFGS